MVAKSDCAKAVCIESGSRLNSQASLLIIFLMIIILVDSMMCLSVMVIKSGFKLIRSVNTRFVTSVQGLAILQTVIRILSFS